MTSARITFQSEAPRMDTSAMPSRMSGKDIIASTQRMIAASRRGKNPASMPSNVPSTTAPAAVKKPIISE
ncbi:hypothetical protein D3C81_2106520 [compost metagenome]